MSVKSPTVSISSKLAAPQARLWRWGWLGLSAVPLLGAFGYGYVMPMAEGDCLFQKAYGFFGPGCGLTRYFVAIAQGDLIRAIQFNLFGPLLFLLFAWGFLQAALELGSRQSLPRRWNLFGFCQRYPASFAGLAIAMLFYYAVRLLSTYGTVSMALENSGFWQFIRLGAQQL